MSSFLDKDGVTYLWGKFKSFFSAHVKTDVPANAVFTDTTYSPFTGTDGTEAGVAGLVPAPSTSDVEKVLYSDGTWGDIASDIFDAIYPIGSIYMSVNNVNPSTLFGGTWETWGSGRVPVGVDTNDANFDTVEETGGAKSQSYTPAGTNTAPSITMNAIELTHSGGAVKGHTLTTSEMPSHTHKLVFNMSGTGGTGKVIPYNVASTIFVGTDSAPVQSTGGGGAHNHGFTQPSKHSFTPTTKSVGKPTFTGTAATISHLQPYITCYMWKRTA